MAEAKKRYAVVTGSNKGIGYEMCRQLASSGITVVLTARDEKKGLEAAQELKKCVPSDNVFFHQLDVADPASIASFADFIKTRFGKLDILINNAGVPGVVTDPDAFRDAFTKLLQTGEGINWDNIIKAETYELAEECVDINYHGMKRMCEALLPLLQLSDSPRIINASSSSGKLQNVTPEWAKGVLSDADNLTEEKIDEVLSAFLKDFKDGVFKAKGWPPYTSAYIMSKSSLNAYTRVLAKKYPNISVNCVDPGFVKTELSHYVGPVSVEQGAAGAVKLALLPDGCPSGLFFAGTEETPF